MEEIVAIFVCVVLPVSIVFIAMLAKRHEVNKKTEVLLKAIESGVAIDPAVFRTQKKQQTVKEKLLGRLTGACVTSLLGVAFIAAGVFLKNSGSLDFIFPLPVTGVILLAVGISLFIVYFVGKQMMAKEIEIEEKDLDSPRE